jgi:hypothetical protein
LITTASGRPVAPETRFASRSSRPRNSLRPPVSGCDPFPAAPLLVPFGLPARVNRFETLPSGIY